MKIVIDIPEDDYKVFVRQRCNDSTPICRLYKAIKNGTVLLNGHGRLIDTSCLLNLLKCEEYESCTWKNCSDCNKEKCIRKHNILEAPTIIPEDKEGKHDE